jgi:hypothetical protein
MPSDDDDSDNENQIGDNTSNADKDVNNSQGNSDGQTDVADDKTNETQTNNKYTVPELNAPTVSDTGSPVNTNVMSKEAIEKEISGLIERNKKLSDDVKALQEQLQNNAKSASVPSNPVELSKNNTNNNSSNGSMKYTLDVYDLDISSQHEYTQKLIVLREKIFEYILKNDVNKLSNLVSLSYLTKLDKDFDPYPLIISNSSNLLTHVKEFIIGQKTKIDETTGKPEEGKPKETYHSVKFTPFQYACYCSSFNCAAYLLSCITMGGKDQFIKHNLAKITAPNTELDGCTANELITKPYNVSTGTAIGDFRNMLKHFKNAVTSAKTKGRRLANVITRVEREYNLLNNNKYDVQVVEKKDIFYFEDFTGKRSGATESFTFTGFHFGESGTNRPIFDRHEWKESVRTQIRQANIDKVKRQMEINEHLKQKNNPKGVGTRKLKELRGGTRKGGTRKRFGKHRRSWKRIRQ